MLLIFARASLHLLFPIPQNCHHPLLFARPATIWITLTHTPLLLKSQFLYSYFTIIIIIIVIVIYLVHLGVSEYILHIYIFIINSYNTHMGLLFSLPPLLYFFCHQPHNCWLLLQNVQKSLYNFVKLYLLLILLLLLIFLIVLLLSFRLLKCLVYCYTVV